jgi:hypothetical protein
MQVTITDEESDLSEGVFLHGNQSEAPKGSLNVQITGDVLLDAITKLPNPEATGAP